MRRAVWAVVVLLWGIASGAHAQHRPDVYGGEVGMTAASDAQQPFWLHANQWGLIEPASANGYARLYAEGPLVERGRLRLSYGADLMARAATRSTLHFSEAFAQLQLDFMRLWAGRRQETLGTAADGLATGAFSVSENATPVPKIALETDGFVAVPYTGGWVQVRGSWAHGWLTGDRYVDTPLLHQKTAFVQLGDPTSITMHAGLIHNVLWGGMSSNPEIGKLPTSLGTYYRAAFAKDGGEDAPRVDRIYKEGNHLGAYDLALTARLDGARLQLYLQHPFEDRSGLHWKNWRDQLIGLSVARRSGGRLFDRLAYEFIHTKHQSGPVHPPGEDNYFRHSTYRTGWTHRGRTIGSPLLFPFPDADRRRSRGIASNRLVGHHAGVGGYVHPAVRYRALATYTRNYGTYKQPFEAARAQLSLLLETHTTLTDRIELLAAIGADVGEVYDDSVGLRLGIAYRGSTR